LWRGATGVAACSSRPAEVLSGKEFPHGRQLREAAALAAGMAGGFDPDARGGEFVS